MNIPRLNRKLVLEAPIRNADLAGGFTTTWQAQGTLWAHLETRAGREKLISGRTASIATYRVTVRAAPQGSAARPKPEQRFRENERLFAIRAVTELDDQGLYLTCVVDEEVVA